MAVRSRLEAIGGRDELVDLLDKIPLVGRSEAENFVSEFEETVADAAQQRILPFLAGACAVGGLALALAIKNRR